MILEYDEDIASLVQDSLNLMKMYLMIKDDFHKRYGKIISKKINYFFDNNSSSDISFYINEDFEDDCYCNFEDIIQFLIGSNGKIKTALNNEKLLIENNISLCFDEYDVKYIDEFKDNKYYNLENPDDKKTVLDIIAKDYIDDICVSGFIIEIHNDMVKELYKKDKRHMEVLIEKIKEIKDYLSWCNSDFNYELVYLNEIEIFNKNEILYVVINLRTINIFDTLDSAYTLFICIADYYMSVS